MELANMLLNQLSERNSSIDIGNKNQINSSQGFISIFDNAKSNIKEKNTNINTLKKNSYTKNEAISCDKSKNIKNNDRLDNVKNDTIKKDDIKPKDFEKPVQNDEVKIQDNKLENTENVESKVENNDNLSEENDELNKIVLFDENLLNQISQLMGISSENLMAIFSELNMSISMLETPENLINFLQDAFNLENPVELLSKDGIKDIMNDISNIAKSIDYKDIANSFEEIKGIIENSIENSNVGNFKLVNLDDTNLSKEIENLLTELNGSIDEVKKLNVLKNDIINEQEFISLDNPEQNIPNTEISMNNNFNNSNNTFNQNQKQDNFTFINKENAEVKIEVFNISDISNNTKVFNATLPKTQALKNINSTEVISQILEKMKTSVKPDMTEVKILLRPEHLGEVSLKISTQNGIVTAQFIAESQKVKEIIESNFNQLKDMLNEQGVDVGALEVNVSDKGQQEFNQFQDMQQKPSKRMDSIISKSFDEENEQNEVKNEKVKLKNSQVDYEI